MRRQSQPDEVRIDPYDELPRTLAELRELSKDKYTEQQILDYWQNVCKKMQAEGLHNVTSDPFLTDISRLQRPAASAQLPSQARGSGSSGPGQPRDTMADPSQGTLRQQTQRGGPPQGQPMVSPVEAGMADVKSDPFLTSGGYRDTVNVKEDPFMTMQNQQRRIGPAASQQPLESLPGQQEATQGFDASAASLPPSLRAEQAKQIMKSAYAAQKKHWTEYYYRIIGDGFADRDPGAKKMLIFLPWMLFTWTMVLGVILRHYNMPVTFFLLGIFLLGSLALPLLWFQGQRKGPISLLSMGVLCSLATVAGTSASIYGWDHHWRQLWWTSTGFRTAATSALTPAASRSDHSVLDFWDANESTTFNGTRVDNLKSAGFKDTDYYCVAPILAPASAGASLARVNFWAVGINCCQRYGGFTCDDTREWDSGTALVMLNGGMPCPTCNIDKFRKAVAKAEAVHGLVSVEGALFVRWVRTSSHLEGWLIALAIVYLFLCSAVALMVCAVLGGIAWYYGLGIQQKGENGMLGSQESSYTPDVEKRSYMSTAGGA